MARTFAFVLAGIPAALRRTYASSATPLRSASASIFAPSLAFLTASARPALPASTRPCLVAQSTMSAQAPTAASATPKVFRLEDYRRPLFLVDNVHLAFELDDAGLNTTVRSRLSVRRAAGTTADEDFVLDGELLKLIPGSVTVDGAAISDDSLTITGTNMTVSGSALPADAFTFETVVSIAPAKNMALEGLYMSSGNYCTQCEAEGFRRITYFPDRPDVMSKYTVRVEGSKQLFPTLLSNGNMIETGEVDGGARHYAVYEDPWAKPCYLFALVAGVLHKLEDKFVTKSGKDVKLSIYVKEAENVSKCNHAMESLKKAFKWEEDTYGLEYQLSIFNVVAVPDFTAGAMENTSLNIFNSALVLVSPETATDGDYNRVEGVVAHEYFHNWSGNRVTLNSWQNLSLKEGLYADTSLSLYFSLPLSLARASED
jgi:aminopeptidase N